MTTSIRLGEIGFYGKIPSLGDFVERRLTPDFVRHWDTWMQEVVSELRRRDGDGWLQDYLGAPIWHFLFPAGVMGDDAWMGAFGPSIDRVGRQFPLLVAAKAPNDGAGWPQLLAASSWSRRIEEAVSEGRRSSVNLGEWSDKLSSLSQYEIESRLPATVANDDAQALPAVFFLRKKAEGGDGQLAEALSTCLPIDSTFFVTSQDQHIICCATSGRPTADQGAALFAGDWVSRGWSEIHVGGGEEILAAFDYDDADSTLPLGSARPVQTNIGADVNGGA